MNSLTKAICRNSRSIVSQAEIAQAAIAQAAIAQAADIEPKSDEKIVLDYLNNCLKVNLACETPKLDYFIEEAYRYNYANRQILQRLDLDHDLISIFWNHPPIEPREALDEETKTDLKNRLIKAVNMLIEKNNTDNRAVLSLICDICYPTKSQAPKTLQEFAEILISLDELNSHIFFQKIVLPFLSKDTWDDLRFEIYSIKRDGGCQANNIGPLINKLREAILDKQAIIRSSVKDLTFREVPGDGDCLFSAIALHLGMDAKKLRRITVGYMRNYESLFKEFSHDDQELRRYIQKMAKPGTWGGQFEIEVIQRLLHRPIIVIQSNAPPVISANMRGLGLTGEPIYVYFHGPSYRHYDALIVNEGHDARTILHNIQEAIRAGKEVTLQSTITPKTSGSQITQTIRITPQELIRMLQLGALARDAGSSLSPGLFSMIQMSDDAIPADPADFDAFTP